MVKQSPEIAVPGHTGPLSDAVEWRVSRDRVPYPDAVSLMERRVEAIGMGRERECVWLLEHPPLYTAGTSARAGDLIAPERFEVFRTGRGGQYTYHGPGQRVAYVMLDLKRRGPDIRRFVRDLEAWLIATLDRFGVHGERREGRVGIWVPQAGAAGGEAKIAAIGVRVRRWVTYHGVSLNIAPDLEHFSGIVPCGIDGYGVTSLRDLGIDASMDQVDAALKTCFDEIFAEAPRRT